MLMKNNLDLMSICERYMKTKKEIYGWEPLKNCCDTILYKIE